MVNGQISFARALTVMSARGWTVQFVGTGHAIKCVIFSGRGRISCGWGVTSEAAFDDACSAAVLDLVRGALGEPVQRAASFADGQGVAASQLINRVSREAQPSHQPVLFGS